jgi:LysR family glycine cleavage system transcriptional activator
MRDVALNGMIYFEAVARLSRVTTAAEELSVSSSAVSQQVKNLEELLGVKLFRRVKRRLVLTEEGERLYSSTNEALRILREARQQLSQKRTICKLNLRVAASFGVHWLGPRIVKFIEQHPNWDLHIDATPELTEFEKEYVDLDIRYGSVKSSLLYSEAILHDAVLPLCSPGFREEALNGASEAEEILRESRLIHTIKANLKWSWWLKHHGITGVDSHAGLKFDRSTMSLQAAMDGAGVVLETATLAMQEMRSGKLVPLFPQLGVVRFPAYWIACPERHLDRRYVAVFCEWLRQEAREHEARKDELLQSLGCIQSLDMEL